MNRDKIEALSQRERKYAVTKTDLLKALLEELETKTLSQVRIRDLAKKAKISEPTFFNYFSSKQDMLYYFIQMWATEMNVIAKQALKESNSYIEAISAIFSSSAIEIAEHPQIMLEIIAFHTQKSNVKAHTVSDAEKWLFFTEIEGIEEFADGGIETIVPPLLVKAVESGELPEDIDIQRLFLTLSSLFFGSALLLLNESPEVYPTLLNQQIEALFKGVKC